MLGKNVGVHFSDMIKCSYELSNGHGLKLDEVHKSSCKSKITRFAVIDIYIKNCYSSKFFLRDKISLRICGIFGIYL